jgi:AcrR family transcriptional regulator
MINGVISRRVTSGKPDAELAFEIAKDQFLRGERVEIHQLVAELEVDRSTLFRWLGNRDQLLVRVMMSITDEMLQNALSTASGRGRIRVANVAWLFAQALINAPYFATFLSRETERAFKLIMTKASPLQQSVVSTFEQLLEQETARGDFSHPLPAGDLAYLIVRIIESYVYSDFIAGVEPDATSVLDAITAILDSRVA